ncbi:MAG: efflux RND transporter periplasmic adaptor subunit [Candidatus Nanopelagicales bacterium]
MTSRPAWLSRRPRLLSGHGRWLNITLIGVLVLILVGGWFWLFKDKAVAVSNRTATVALGSVASTVTASGTVESSGNYALSFATNGTVTKVYVKTGQKVKAGAPLVSVDSTTAAQQLATATTSYAQAVASNSQNTMTLTSAQQSLADAKTNAVTNATSYQQAVDKAQLDLDSATAGASAACLNPASQPTTTDCANSQAWATLRNLEAGITTATLDLQKSQSQAALNLNAYNAAISQATTSDALVNANNAKDKGVLADQAAINSAQTNLFKANVALLQQKDTLTRAVVSAQQTYNAAMLNQQKGTEQDRQAVSKAEQALKSTEASSSLPKNLGVASVAAASEEAARLQLANAHRAYDATTLRSPVAGTVGAVDATVGQSSASSNSSSASSVVTIVGRGALDVTASFNESDAAKVKAGQSATISFTALPDTTATGKVISVSPIASTSDGLTTYPVIISITDAPDGVLAGMSADVSVTTSEATDVLVVPSTTVTSLGGTTTVTVVKGETETITPVTVGVKGDSTSEITSGLKAGDIVVVPTAVSSTTSNGFPAGGIPGGGLGGTALGGTRIAGRG